MSPEFTRENTRRERYNLKLDNAKSLPAAIVSINFDFDENLAFLIRSAACYGINKVFVIGSVPSRSLLNSKSGSLYDYVDIKSFSNPSDFKNYCNDYGYKIVSLELSEYSESIYDYKFSFDKKTAIVLGNETSGVPVDLLINNDSIYIPMLGPGYCLNASQTGTAVMQEYTRQYLDSI